MSASVIDPLTFEDEWFGQLCDREMIVWIGVFSRLRDDQGRFTENAALARARLWPYRDIPVSDVQDAFDRFVKDGRLHRYQVGQQQLLQIVTWWKHQRPQWAAPSKLLPPEGWTDRVRTRLSGTYRAVNWDSPGGFARTVQVEVSGEEVKVDPSADPFGLACEPEPEPEPYTEPTKRKIMPADAGAFDSFYEIYPRKIARQKALRAWNARLNDGHQPGDMTTAARVYADHCRKAHTEPRFIQHPSTFIGPDVPYVEWLHGVPIGEQPNGNAGRSGRQLDTSLGVLKEVMADLQSEGER